MSQALLLQDPANALAAARPALRELGDLKRVRVAGSKGSLAEQGFLRSWRRLVSGEDVGRVAAEECARALCAARLGGVDADVLRIAGLSDEDIAVILRRAYGEVAGRLPWAYALADHVTAEPGVETGLLDELPHLIELLAVQPRAGATYPGRPRILVEPPESHGDHCFITGLYAALLAPAYAAVPEDAFLLGLAHHLHNAVMPDSGFAGEVLLGDALGPVVESLTAAALGELPTALGARIATLLPARDDAGSALGRAFHAADVLDRVLQVHHHARAAAFTAEQALVDLDIVHPGPVQGFQLDVLAAAGLTATGLSA